LTSHEDKKTLFKSRSFNATLLSISRKLVRYYCPNSDFEVHYPVDEVIRPSYCQGCGKKHMLERDALSKADLEHIQRLTEAARQDPSIYYNLESEAYHEALRAIRKDREEFAGTWAINPDLIPNS
jgi:hypothetical protein